MKENVKTAVLSAGFMSDEDILKNFGASTSSRLNSRKTLAPVYICDFLKEHKGKRYTQAQISDYLLKEKEIDLSRGALSRVLHTLAEENIVYYCSPEGTWYEGGNH